MMQMCSHCGLQTAWVSGFGKREGNATCFLPLCRKEVRRFCLKCFHFIWLISPLKIETQFAILLELFITEFNFNCLTSSILNLCVKIKLLNSISKYLFNHRVMNIESYLQLSNPVQPLLFYVTRTLKVFPSIHWQRQRIQQNKLKNQTSDASMHAI